MTNAARSLGISMGCFIALCIAVAASPARSQGLCVGSGKYTDPAYATAQPFGWHSHWYQPWRSYMETMPAVQFVDGIGANINQSGPNADLTCEMLRKYGFRAGRFEMGWGGFNYEDPTRYNGAAQLTPWLQACKKWGIRPLILLNAHHGGPCPNIGVPNISLVSPAAVGDKVLHLNSITGIVPGYTGINNEAGNYWMAEDLITSLNGNTATLSAPLLNAYAAGTTLNLSTLKYRPFSTPSSLDYNATIAGWQQYVRSAASYVSSVLGTTGNAADKGFDLEVWNELTFGDNFLYINDYYNNNYNARNPGSPYAYDDTVIWNNLAQATADCLNAHPQEFTGVTLTDGFSNTIPWTASSTLDPRFGALNKHPYPPTIAFPAKDQGPNRVDANGKPDPGGWVPTYTANFPEYMESGLQTECNTWDISPNTTSMYGVKHGRYARGKSNPCWVWITENGLEPSGLGVKNPDLAWNMKAKYLMRTFCFYLNKGVQKQFIYSEYDAGADGDLGFSLIPASFRTYAGAHSTYPSPDSPYVSTPLRCVGNIVHQFRRGMDPRLTYGATRAISVASIAGASHRAEFVGDGTKAHPDLYDTECLAILPYQVNAHRFIIPYYVMTRNVVPGFTFAPEPFTFTLDGIHAAGALVTVYDPYYDKFLPVKFTTAAPNSITVQAKAADYPYLLIVQEQPDKKTASARRVL